MKFRIIETHSPKLETTMYTVHQAFKGRFGFGTVWCIVEDDTLSFRGGSALEPDGIRPGNWEPGSIPSGLWKPRRFISIKDAEAAIEKYKRGSQPITMRVVKEL
jgi:hypothetical protein